MVIVLRTRKQNIALKRLLHRLVHLNSCFVPKVQNIIVPNQIDPSGTGSMSRSPTARDPSPLSSDQAPHVDSSTLSPTAGPVHTAEPSSTSTDTGSPMDARDHSLQVAHTASTHTACFSPHPHCSFA